MTKDKWTRISIALTKRELEMLKIVKNWFGVNSRDMVRFLIGSVWDDIPKKYKKKLEEKQGNLEKQKKKVKRKISEAKRGKTHGFD